MSELVALEVRDGPPSAEVLELRRVVLRDGGPLESARFPGDEDADTIHVLAWAEGALVGVGTLMREALAPRSREPGSQWRVRGMAVDASWRGQGIGSRMLEALLGAAPEDAGLLWCRARLRAVPLYARHGFVPEGEVYEIAGIGPHLTMVRR